MYSIGQTNIETYELFNCLTHAADFVRADLANHHLQVAYLSFRISEQLKLPAQHNKDVLLAGLLHDIGALSYEEQLELVEETYPFAFGHAFKGAWLLEKFNPLVDISNIIRYHHLPWNHGKGITYKEKRVPFASHMVHLADRIAVLLDSDKDPLMQVERIEQSILERRDIVFEPTQVDAFLALSKKEYFWLDLIYKPALERLVKDNLSQQIEINSEELIELTRIFAKIVDFQSPFTVNHSTGVAKIAERLAIMVGLSKTQSKHMLIAGYLHDLGKLAVGNEILEKPGKLGEKEFSVMRSHTYYTFRLLQMIKGFDNINLWASLHHEKLNGRGYPFRLKGEDIPLGSRVMMLADIFTAITEDRPYRQGMSRQQASNVLIRMVEKGEICPYVTSLVLDNFDLLNEIRMSAQRSTNKDYGDYVAFTKADL